MIDKSIIEKTTSWPFVEARKLIKDKETNLKKKAKLLFKLVTVLAAYLILEPSERLQELV